MVKFAIAALLVAAAAAQCARGGELLLLDFASPHCGPCQQMIPTVQSLEAAGYHVRRIDTTLEPQMAQQYGVTQIPCFIMLADGLETERIVGATSQDRLVTMYRNAMGRIRTQSPGVQSQAQPPTQQATADPWSGVGNTGGVDTGGTDAPARPMTHTAPLGPREPLRDAFSNQLVNSSVRLRVDDPGGHSYGTGTIIDARGGEALVITCGHLFRDSQGKGPVMVELFVATPEGVRVVAQVPGQIIDYNLDRDIGLVSIRPNAAVSVAPVAPTQTIIERGDRLTSVGCDHGKDPTALATRVTNVDRYQGPPNIEASGAPVEGRSGGGLFNSAGQLVGVCFAADYEGNEGLYTALESIHDEMDRLNLSSIYGKPSEHVDMAAETDQIVPVQPPATTATPPIVRGQEPLQPVMPVANSGAMPKAVFANTAATAPQLAPVEQAALEEIMRRATDSEVVCIIRPLEPGGKSEVITLPRVSPEFIRAIGDRASAEPATIRR
jgi:thiol-disulfide isomerase/thioredoxin